MTPQQQASSWLVVRLDGLSGWLYDPVAQCSMKEITPLRAGFSMGRPQSLAKVEKFPRITRREDFTLLLLGLL